MTPTARLALALLSGAGLASASLAGSATFQFLTEAVTISLVGGLIGILGGWGLGILGAKAIPGFPPAHVPIWAIALAFGFAAIVGIFFGTYPAAKAAGLDPIDALRYE